MRPRPMAKPSYPAIATRAPRAPKRQDEALLPLFCRCDRTVQEQATLAVGNIVSGQSQLDTQQRVLELGVLDTLARLRRSSIPKLARAAAGTLEALVHSLTPASRRALNADPVATVRAERRARPRRSSPLVTSHPQGLAA